MKGINEKWCILRTPENAKVINDWANTYCLQGGLGNWYRNDSYLYCHGNCIIYEHYNSPHFDKSEFTDITFEQFKEWFIQPKVELKETPTLAFTKEELAIIFHQIDYAKNNTYSGTKNPEKYWSIIKKIAPLALSTKDEIGYSEVGVMVSDIKNIVNEFEESQQSKKKIIGWKFKDRCSDVKFQKACACLIGGASESVFANTIDKPFVTKNRETIERLNDFGVLKLWFEPVFKEEILSSNIKFSKPTEKSFDVSVNRMLEIDEIGVTKIHEPLTDIEWNKRTLSERVKEELKDYSIKEYSPKSQIDERYELTIKSLKTLIELQEEIIKQLKNRIT